MTLSAIWLLLLGKSEPNLTPTTGMLEAAQFGAWAQNMCPVLGQGQQIGSFFCAWAPQKDPIWGPAALDPKKRILFGAPLAPQVPGPRAMSGPEARAKLYTQTPDPPP